MPKVLQLHSTQVSPEQIPVLIMNPASPFAIFSLYRQMIRKARTLSYTDKNFYLHRIRKEFDKNKSITDPHELQRSLEKGKAFLRRDRLL
ncbi:MIEF1 upstream open reading frame protein isoform X2 [Octopus sinensis]|uniref:MIEF1 upstream open reading frame protein isoform X2 n=1 Tax=Octopus sinensis TaxID=2607531 RepID=A0A6P7SQF0_9MOLL|nr:MIEF1 upstream open reading frame protein isoform X2 [Octopus sinensis]